MTRAHKTFQSATTERSHIDDLNMQKLAECEESIDSLKWMVTSEIRNILYLEGRLNTQNEELRRQLLLQKSIDLLNTLSGNDIAQQLIQKHTKSILT